MNSVVLIGRLTRNPEVRYTEAQLAIARFSLAVDRQRYGNREDGNTADFINNLFRKITGICAGEDRKVVFVVHL